MQAISNINLHSTLDTFVSLSLAFILGAMIGLERQYRQRTAGLRTNVLVAMGAAVFVDMGNRLTGSEGAVHVIAKVVLCLLFYLYALFLGGLMGVLSLTEAFF